MTREELLAMDHRTHLVVDGVQACPAPSDGLNTTSEVLWSTCSACLANADRLLIALNSEAAGAVVLPWRESATSAGAARAGMPAERTA